MTDNVRHQRGDKIAGYVLEDQIGAGGMAVVFRARDDRLGRPVALKLLAPGLAADDGFRQRFIRESRAAAAVDHPNIIPIYEAGEADGVLFIAMRYVQGGDVRALLDGGGPLPAARAWAIISQIAKALDAAHRHGLVHRDIKPGNILLDAGAGAAGPNRGPGPAGPSEHVYLSDFGISKQPSGASGLTLAGQFLGTLDYIAPEQLEGHGLDGRADLYSLGCAAYELLSGRPPFRPAQGLALIRAHLSERPPALTAERPDLPPAVDWVLARAMAKSPGERYLTGAEFAADLGRSLGLLPGHPVPPRAGTASGAVTQQAQYRDTRPGPVRDYSHPATVTATAPARQPAARPRSPRLVAGAIIAGLAVVAASIVAAAVLARGPGTASASGSAEITAQNAQAQNVSTLLSSSTGSISQLEPALGEIDDCTDLAGGIRALAGIRDQRSREYAKAQHLSVSLLPEGSSLKSDLTQALRYSLLVDSGYLNWATRESQDGCQEGTEPGLTDQDVTGQDNTQASDFKRDFLQLWNPIAVQHGLAQPTSL
jgi:serine/threonine protein kinase